MHRSIQHGGACNIDSGGHGYAANVYLLNDKGNFEPAVNPLNRYSTVRKDLSMQRLGPAYGFAKEMTRKTKRPLGLVVNARGGSSINSWLKGSKDGYYEEALSRIRIAMKQGGVLKAILWHQGEADCSNPEAYKQKLISLVKDLREDLNMPDLPVVVGQISQWNWTKREAGTVPFNQMIKKYLHLSLIAIGYRRKDWDGIKMRRILILIQKPNYC